MASIGPIPLGGFAPGSHLVKLEVTDEVAGTTAVQEAAVRGPGVAGCGLFWLALARPALRLARDGRRRRAPPPSPSGPSPARPATRDGRLFLRDAVVVVPAGDPRAQYPGRLLAELVADQFGVALPVAIGQAPEGRTAIVVGEVSAAKSWRPRRSARWPRSRSTAEGYALRIGEAACRGGGTRLPRRPLRRVVLRPARQPLGQAERRRRARPRSATGRFLPLRFVHLFLPARDQLAFARRYLRDFLLRYKFNGVVLEIGGGMRYESHPEISAGWRRTVAEWYAHGETIDKLGEGIPLGTANRFAASLHVGVGGGSFIEKDDLRRLAEWAADYGLEIIPEMQSLSHTYYISSARRDVAEDPDMAWPDSYCPSNPESYRILFDLLDEVVDVLKPRRVHIGHDEWRAGAFCSRCRGKDTGELFAEDVLKIHRHLEEKGIETWLWGDHFVDGHNRFGKSWAEGGVVRYERPDTRSARDRLAAAGAKLHVFNWSGEEGDADVPEAGLALPRRQLRGHARRRTGRAASGASERSAGEVSSWGAFEEFVLGKLQIPEAAFSANLLWSSQYPAPAVALEQVGRPDARGPTPAGRGPAPVPACQPHALRGVGSRGRPSTSAPRARAGTSRA